MNFYAFSALIDSAIFAFLFFIFLIKRPWSRMMFHFNLFNLAILVWSSSYFFWQTSSAYDQALFWVQMLMAGAIFIGPVFFHFAAVATKNDKKQRLWIVVSYLLTIPFLYLDFTSSGYIKGLETKMGIPFFPTAGIYYIFFLAQWAFWIFFAFYDFIGGIKNSTGDEQVFLRRFTISSFISFAAGAWNFFLWFNIPIPPVTTLVTGAYGVWAALLILRGRFYTFHLLYFEIFSGVILLVSLLQFFLENKVNTRVVNLIMFGMVALLSYFMLRAGRRERKNVEKIDALNRALSESINKVINSMNAGVLIVNKSLEIIGVNKEALSMFGQGKDHPNTFPAFVGASNRVITSGLEKFLKKGTRKISTILFPSVKQLDVFFSKFSMNEKNDSVIVILQDNNPPWGTVFDSETLTPIPLVLIRVFDKAKNRLVATKVTDERGRFDFIVSPGAYFLKAFKTGYGNEFTKRNIGYQGGEIEIKEGNMDGMNVNILLDPIVKSTKVETRKETTEPVIS